MTDDYTATIQTEGTVAVGATASGNIESASDRDWFEVELVAGRTYTIDLRGARTDNGTLNDPYLYGIHDADGNLITGTTDDDGGGNNNSRVTFTATVSGAHYIAAGAHAGNRGTYELEVTDTAVADTTSPPDPTPDTVSPPDTTSPPDADATRAGATDLGDITALGGPRFSRGTVDGDADRVDYYQFTLTAAKRVGLGLRQQDADADLFLEDADGAVLYSSTTSGMGKEKIEETLLAGTYYVRVEAQAAGVNAHVVRYGVSAPDADRVAELQQQSVTVTNAAPTFVQQGYTFALAENADGSTNRISLGTVAATDPEGTALAYSLVGAGGSFAIDATSGELFYAGSGEDFESGTTQFTLTARASDGSETADTTVTVNVTDVEEPVAVDPPVSQPQEAAPQTVSEPEDEDFSQDTSTSGRVVVGETATGNIGRGGDRDWFAVELVAGRTYTIDLRGRATEDGTLRDPFLKGIHDADGNLIAGTKNDDGGHRLNSQVTFTATASGAHYIAAGAWHGRGTYELEVTDSSPATPPPASGDSETPIVQEVETTETTETDSTPPPVSGESGTPIVRVADASATEGDDPLILFRVTLDRASTEAVTVNYTTVDGSAEAGEDYERTSGTLTFAAGETEKYVQVTVIDDEVEDSGETFRLVLSDPSGGQLGDTDATGTIFNTEPAVDETTENTDMAGDTSTLGRVSVNGGTATGDITVRGGGNPPDRDWYRVELEAGETYRIDVGGDRFAYLEGIYNAGGWKISQTSDAHSGPTKNPRLYFTPDEDGHYFIAVTTYGSHATSSFDVNYRTRLTVVTDDPDDDYSDDTDTIGTVTVNGAAATGEVTYTRDRDWFAVDLNAGTTYEITLRPDSGASDQLDATYLRGIYDSNGDLLPDTWNFGAIQEQFSHGRGGYRQYTGRVEFTPDDTGTYYISASGHASSTGSYELEVDTM